MPIEQSSFAFASSVNVVFFLKLFFILFVIFYTFFAFMLFKQIQLVTKEFYTPVMPFLKFIGIVNFGISLALIFLVMGLF
ncbi:hypothetical protein A3I53_01190 [Candidatus Curtissbacteria bacterium RIFCSPLOWO2_02_FULL_40_13b]|uniref:Uncharacterized protein n=1 Tax=Candidatus Curtissbacteria bacterium RIFCSPLOWO2_02_FULL_40_13b TaxID=1797733 RepID=A0A1F5HRT5_9BACT|nr:MAG: hypothetical protein A3I53_01190 [Candidatus Curtissbacteria bacterium RIFCSPLOWO2_02_FULL_40_13b]